MFIKQGKYLLLRGDLQFPYRVYKQTSEFIARFKYKGPVTMSKFIKELITSHSVEDYLYKLNVERKAPLEILREKNPVWYRETQNKWLMSQREGST